MRPPQAEATLSTHNQQRRTEIVASFLNATHTTLVMAMRAPTIEVAAYRTISTINCRNEPLTERL